MTIPITIITLINLVATLFNIRWSSSLSGSVIRMIFEWTVVVLLIEFVLIILMLLDRICMMPVLATMYCAIVVMPVILAVSIIRMFKVWFCIILFIPISVYSINLVFLKDYLVWYIVSCVYGMITIMLYQQINTCKQKMIKLLFLTAIYLIAGLFISNSFGVLEYEDKFGNYIFVIIFINAHLQGIATSIQCRKSDKKKDDTIDVKSLSNYQ